MQLVVGYDKVKCVVMSFVEFGSLGLDSQYSEERVMRLCRLLCRFDMQSELFACKRENCRVKDEGVWFTSILKGGAASIVWAGKGRKQRFRCHCSRAPLPLDSEDSGGRCEVTPPSFSLDTD